MNIYSILRKARCGLGPCLILIAALPALSIGWLSRTAQQRIRAEASLAPSPSLTPLIRLGPAPSRVDVARLVPACVPYEVAPNYSVLLHAFHLYGPEASVVARSGVSLKVQDVLLDAPLWAASFGTEHPLSRAGPTARFRVYEARLRLSPSLAAEGHHGQTLATLAAAGVPLDAPVKLGSGESLELRSFVDDLRRSIVLVDDICWQATALALYSPAKEPWRNERGEEISFGRIVDALMGRSPSGISCGGTHHLIALTTLLRVDQERPILTELSRSRIRSFLSENCDLLRRNQDDRGVWCSGWYCEPGRGGVAPDPASDPRDELMVTGHHLDLNQA